jgi:hypothetical protein
MFAAHQPKAARQAAGHASQGQPLQSLIDMFVQRFTWFVSCVSLCHDRLRITQFTRWMRASTESQSQWQGRGWTPLPSLVLTLLCCAACRCVCCALQAEFQLSPRTATSRQPGCVIDWIKEQRCCGASSTTDEEQHRPGTFMSQ